MNKYRLTEPNDYFSKSGQTAQGTTPKAVFEILFAATNSRGLADALRQVEKGTAEFVEFDEYFTIEDCDFGELLAEATKQTEAKEQK